MRERERGERERGGGREGEGGREGGREGLVITHFDFVPN